MINKRERSRCKQTRHKQTRSKYTRRKQTRRKQRGGKFRTKGVRGSKMRSLQSAFSKTKSSISNFFRGNLGMSMLKSGILKYSPGRCVSYNEKPIQLTNCGLQLFSKNEETAVVQLTRGKQLAQTMNPFKADIKKLVSLKFQIDVTFVINQLPI